MSVVVGAGRHPLANADIWGRGGREYRAGILGALATGPDLLARWGARIAGNPEVAFLH